MLYLLIYSVVLANAPADSVLGNVMYSVVLVNKVFYLLMCSVVLGNIVLDMLIYSALLGIVVLYWLMCHLTVYWVL